ncbi:hypothetical protein C8R44DRAFT_740732 [Mycena epipterygia]|nr:hypothetical protein C8R44DRAFT_740732 [Mycena epipterygia]
MKNENVPILTATRAPPGLSARSLGQPRRYQKEQENRPLEPARLETNRSRGQKARWTRVRAEKECHWRVVSLGSGVLWMKSGPAAPPVTCGAVHVAKRGEEVKRCPMLWCGGLRTDSTSRHFINGISTVWSRTQQLGGTMEQMISLNAGALPKTFDSSQLANQSCLSCEIKGDCSTNQCSNGMNTTKISSSQFDTANPARCVINSDCPLDQQYCGLRVRGDLTDSNVEMQIVPVNNYQTGEGKGMGKFDSGMAREPWGWVLLRNQSQSDFQWNGN